MPINLYKIYINAWSNYEEDKLMDMLRRYLNKDLDKLSSDWFDIKYFHKHFTIKRGDVFDSNCDYAISDDNGDIVWEGDYPTEEVIKEILNNY